MRASVRSALKQLRASQPFNRLATSLVRASVRALGTDWPLAVKYLRRIGSVEDRLPNGHRLHLWTNGEELITNLIFWRGWASHEPDTMPLFYRLAERASVVFDLGANIGLYSLVAGHANPAARIFAFEPFPAACARLKELLIRNGLSNVECVQAAVGAEDGSGEFFYTTQLAIPDTSSLCVDNVELTRTYASEFKGELRSLSVAIRSLDSFVEERRLPRVDVVKIDTEGTEPAVIRGMRQTLERDRPPLICEVLRGFNTHDELMSLVAPLGYRYYLLTDAGPEPRPRIEPQPNGHWEWRNYLLTTLAPSDVARL